MSPIPFDFSHFGYPDPQKRADRADSCFARPLQGIGAARQNGHSGLIQGGAR